MVDNIHGIKHRCFGIEIELTGITRCQAAQAVADLFGTYVSHNGGYYDKYTVLDNQNREWSFVFDSSIDAVNNNRESAGDSYKVELNSPVLCYEDIPLLQEVIRALRHIGGVTGPNYCCGTHIHISADDYTPQQIRNLVNIFSSKENYLWDALQISSARSTYCRKSDPEFIQNINRLKPKTMQKIQNLWYKGNEDEINTHYSSTRYHAFYAHQTIMQSKTLKPHGLVGFRGNTQHNFRGSGGTSLDQDYHSSQAKPESVNRVLFFSKLSVLLPDLPLHKLVWFLQIHVRENLGCR